MTHFEGRAKQESRCCHAGLTPALTAVGLQIPAALPDVCQQILSRDRHRLEFFTAPGRTMKRNKFMMYRMMIAAALFAAVSAAPVMAYTRSPSMADAAVRKNIPPPPKPTPAPPKPPAPTSGKKQP
ncbi:hypothetical protein XH79_20540 [Bradyrhizobium sp. CCBAU 45389]|nr:hypothetical protein [Bradyrhizobium sp. CCBAU 45389]